MLKRYSVCALFCMLAVNAFAKSPTHSHDETDIGPSPMRIELRHIENKGVGYNTGYTTLEAFLAPSKSKITPFLDLRGHVFDNGKFAANAGIGIRLLNDCRVYGANIYYDYRHTKRQHYNQVSFGFETLGVRWDFRINGYIPVGPKKSNPYEVHTSITNPSFESFFGHEVVMRQTITTNSKVEFAMQGGDAEAAYHILKNKNIDFYAAAGPYCYNYKNKQALGGKVRLFAQIYKYLSLELINSYDTRFHENIQGSIGINIPFGGTSKISKNKKLTQCKEPYLLNQRLFQDVERQEIIVVDHLHQKTSVDRVSLAINPATGLPYYFVFVNNTSSSLGTYESPYPTLALAQDNSKPNDIIYVFPGDGTTHGMNSGIALQASQMFFGSGVSHIIPTSEGPLLIPKQSSSSPTITNTDISTLGDAIILAPNNIISGFNIIAATNDAIQGVDLHTDFQSLTVSSCTFENISQYAIEALFSRDAYISLTNNQFLNNANGVALTLHGTSTLVCSDNTFNGQTSPSEQPLQIEAHDNVIDINIENNIFNNNKIGSVSFDLTSVLNADIVLLNNTMTNNSTGSRSSLGSSLVISSHETINHCSLVLTGNTFSENIVEPGGASSSLRFETSGSINTLEVTATRNTLSNNVGSGLVLATPVTNTLTLIATDNIISQLQDNAISISGAGVTANANITINNNTISDLSNYGNAIALAQGTSTLNFTVENNTINRCEGSGITCISGDGFTDMTATIVGNVINDCQNGGSNSASGISLETYVNLTSVIANNSLSSTATPGVGVGIFTSGNPTVCLTLTGNSSEPDPGYLLVNPGSGDFNLSPCNVESVNIGAINTSGVIPLVQSCSNPTLCSP